MSLSTSVNTEEGKSRLKKKNPDIIQSLHKELNI